MSGCIFCRIVDRKAPARVLYEDDTVMAFRDINPQAPVHVLVIPKKHISTLMDASEEDMHLYSHIMKIVNRVAADTGIAENGFRLVANCNPAGGQTVCHVHFHILGGRQMHWPPG